MFHTNQVQSVPKNRLVAGLSQALVVAGLMMGSVAAGAADQSGAQGFWLMPEGAGLVEVSTCHAKTEKLCGTVVWAEDAGKKGDVVLSRFSQSGDVWTGGKATLAGKRQSEQGQLTLLGGNELKVSACKGGKCRHETWTRADDARLASLGVIVTQ